MNANDLYNANERVRFVSIRLAFIISIEISFYSALYPSRVTSLALCVSMYISGVFQLCVSRRPDQCPINYVLQIIER